LELLCSSPNPRALGVGVLTNWLLHDTATVPMQTVAAPTALPFRALHLKSNYCHGEFRRQAQRSTCTPTKGRVYLARRSSSVMPKAIGKGPGDDGGRDDDKVAELTARDVAMSRELQSRISEIKSRPFYYPVTQAIKKEGLSRRVLLGGVGVVALTGALIRTSLVSSASGGGNSSKSASSVNVGSLPLSYFISEVLACDVALQQARDYAAEGEWIQYNTLRRRISDGATKKSLELVINKSGLNGREADRARSIRTDFFELVDQMDYTKYTNQLTNTGDAYTNNLEDARKREFSVNATAAARAKLQDFIDLLPQDDVQYALSGGANGLRGSSGTIPSPGSL